MPSEPHFQTAFTIKISYQTLTNAIIPSNEYKADFLPDAYSFTLNIPFPANDFVNRLAVAGGMPVSSARRLLRETGWVNIKSSTVNECLEDSISVNTVFISSYSAWIFWAMSDCVPLAIALLVKRRCTNRSNCPVVKPPVLNSTFPMLRRTRKTW